jgi:signal transduction histidine kinase
MKEKEYELARKQNELFVFKSIIKTQESERERIAANVHDDIGPLVSAMKLHLSKHEIMLERGELSKTDLTKEREYVDFVMESIRRTTRDLSPMSLLNFGIVSAVKSFLFELSAIDVCINEDVDEKVEIEDQFGINIYRVVLELVNNIIKHGKATKMEVEISLRKDKLEFSFSHNGLGINNEEFAKYAESSDGLGLKSLKSRITLLKAELNYQKEVKSKVFFIVPLNNEKDD